MSELGAVTDAVLERARQDPIFRHQLVADHLELLLNELNRLRSLTTDATRARQIRDALTETDISASDKRVKFVTLKAFVVKYQLNRMGTSSPRKRACRNGFQTRPYPGFRSRFLAKAGIAPACPE